MEAIKMIRQRESSPFDFLWIVAAILGVFALGHC